MNVNGSRFELLLGRADWGRCLDGDDERALPLSSWWGTLPTSPPTPAPATLPFWDEQRAEICVRPVTIELPGTPGESRLTLDARRGAAADRHGNVYHIGSDRSTLRVTSAGARRETPFWPAGPSGCEDARRAERPDFGPAEPATPAPADRYLALAVTADDYLVVAFANGGTRGFLSFDLVSGGPPHPTLWPTGEGFEPIDMAARCGGGVWVLDRTAASDSRLLWELDRALAVVSRAQPTNTLEPEGFDDFQPRGAPPRARPAVTFPGGIELLGANGWVVEPIAVETLGRGAILLLDRDDAAGRSRVVRLRREGDAWSADPSRWLDELPDPAHDFVHARGRLFGREERTNQLFIATAGGNQARAYSLIDTPDSFQVHGAAELFPLRRFGGRALLAVRGEASYDSGIDRLAWTPLVHQPRARYERVAELVTPVLDSRELDTTWDRVLFDGCVPPDTTVQVWSRAGDERADLLDGTIPTGEPPQVVGGWLPEPTPRLRPSGPELPWLRDEAAPTSRREAGVGTWELLLQKARGRYLQLRLRLVSESGLLTPRIRALRAWSPRFSYPERFLPAVYREDETSGSLLERWLANPESTLTEIEERVARAQALFDPRTAPAATLAWLADWLDIALDPSWDERRRRLFVAHAMEFFRWRGTVHGLSTALEMAFTDRFDASVFDSPERRDGEPRPIRVVEAYQTRLIGALAAGDPDSGVGPREVRREALWTPAEGNAGLMERWAQARGEQASVAEQIEPFPLLPPPGKLEIWRRFAESSLGFVPSAGAADRTRWQALLRGRHPTIEELRHAHQREYAAYDRVTLPADWPTSATEREDWSDFVAGAEGRWVRGRWQDFLARRHRHVQRLNRAYSTAWPSFDLVPLPDVLPETVAAQVDWLQFERQVLAMHRTAHRFSVLLPVCSVEGDPYELERRLGLARRIVELEKPAHTAFDVRYYWAFFRIGEARLGLDTVLGAGSRAPELIPDAVLGRTYIGSSFVGGPARPAGADRLTITC